MSKRHYRSIFISDLHLCTRDCRIDAILDFLSHTKCDYLYLVGDIIDIWQLRRRWYWPQEYNNALHRILKWAKKGTEVVFIPGNHDEFFRDFAGHHFGGVKICQQALHTTADGRQMLVLHGDEFDSAVHCNRWLALLGSAAYEYLVMANRYVNAVRKRMGMPYWSMAGAVKRKVKNAVKFINGFEKAVSTAAINAKVDGVICGHIHQPVIKSMDGLLYCNTGDWVENCSALVEDESGELKILFWLKDGQQIVRELGPRAGEETAAEHEPVVLPGLPIPVPGMPMPSVLDNGLDIRVLGRPA